MMISTFEFLKKLQSTELPQVSTKRQRKPYFYYNVPAAFDIETSSFYQNDEKNAIMYHWQFGIGDEVTFGRTWEDLQIFLTLLEQTLGLDEKHRLIIYVHNLPTNGNGCVNGSSGIKSFSLMTGNPSIAEWVGLNSDAA